MNENSTNQQRFALERAAIIEDVPVEQLVSEPWPSPIPFKHTIGAVRNMEYGN